jgi:predicted GIY-YIG superfamily endonuclease
MFYLYILKLDNKMYYTGITNNLVRRWLEHLKNTNHTTSRFKFKILVYVTSLSTRRHARTLEVYVKNLGAGRYLKKIRRWPTLYNPATVPTAAVGTVHRAAAVPLKILKT